MSELIHRHDKDLELTLLACCFCHPECLSEPWSAMPTEVFYSERNRQVWDEIQRQYAQHGSFDFATVAAAFRVRGDFTVALDVLSPLTQIFGGSYHPTSAYAHLYAQQAKELYVVREKGRAALKYQAVIASGGDQNEARLELDAVLTVLDSAVQSFDERSDEELAALIGSGARYATGYGDFDYLTGGIAKPGLNILAARPSVGKALAVDTIIPTPTRPKFMGELRVGDFVFGSDGEPCQIVAATEELRGRPCYRVTFSDGTQIVADALHQWATETRNPRNGSGVYTTEQIRDTLTAANGTRKNHRVKVAGVLEYPEAKLLVDPYLLGVWLGDGKTANARITIADRDYSIIEELNRRGIPTSLRERRENCGSYTLSDGDRTQVARDRSIQAALREIGVLGVKHIPELYQRASAAQRLDLLRGIIDTDGHVDKRGQVEIALTDERLARDTLMLIRSLGHVPMLRVDVAKLDGRVIGPRYRVWFAPANDVPVATVAFKKDRAVVRTDLGRARAGCRQIVSVEPVASVPVRCIQVDAPDHLFLAGESNIPTHNSALARGIIRNVVARGERVLWYSQDQSENQILELEIARHKRLDTKAVQRMPFAEVAQGIRDVREKVWCDRVTLVDTPVRLDNLITLIKTSTPGLVVIDYLQILDTGHSDEYESVTAASKALKTLAFTLRIPILALAQFNRGFERGKVPSLSNLRGSGQIEQDADIVMALDRDTTLSTTVQQEATWYVLKNKVGATGSVPIHWHGKWAAYESAAPKGFA